MRTIFLSFGYSYINYKTIYFMWLFALILFYLMILYYFALISCSNITNYSAMISYANLCFDILML